MWSLVLKDNLKACVPFKPLIRRTLRRLAPYRSLPANDDFAIAQGLQLVRLARTHALPLNTVLEVGTGWIPTLPMMLKACGADRLILTDIERLCDEVTFTHARTLVERSLAQLSEASGLGDARLRANLDRSGVEDYRCPPRLDALPDASVDLVYSRTVLEHIPPDLLGQLLAQWRRLLRPGAGCIHIIDNSDHFEHRDKRLSRLHFLTLSDAALKFSALNAQNYQNRLRHSDYVKLFRDAGFELLRVEGEVHEQTLSELDRMILDPRFAAYAPDDLATLTSIIVARNPG